MLDEQIQDGFSMMPNALSRCGKLTPKAMAIFVCLKSHAGTSNRTWLSHRTIAFESGNSPSAVKTGLQELKQLGLVTWKGRIRSTDGGQTSNMYHLHDTREVLGRLYQPSPQSFEDYQEEKPNEEKLLNSSSKGRAKVRNIPSREKPATEAQIALLSSLFDELSLNSSDHFTEKERENLSRYEADELIKELKIEKYRLSYLANTQG
jgi:hypothetical protein